MTHSEIMLDYLDEGQIDEAMKEFARALRKDNDATLFSLAEELYSLGFLAQSKRTYERLLEKYPEEDTLKTFLADIAISEGKSDEALNYLSEIEEDSEAYLQSLMVAADLYQTQGMFEVSENKLLTAYKLAPEEEVIQFALGELYFNTKQFSQAIGFYLELIKSGQTELSQVNLVQRLGVSYANSGQFEKAMAYLEQIHLENMDSDTKLQMGLTYLQLNDQQKAIDILYDLKEEDPSYTSLYPILGQALSNENRLNDALLVYQEGLAVDEVNDTLYEQAATVALKLDDEKQAEKYLNKAIDINPDNTGILLQLSNLLVKQERDDEDIKLLEDIKSDGDVDPQIFWNLAISYERLEDYDKAEENYLEAYPYFTNQVDFLRSVIFIFRENGRQEELKDAIKHYLALVPDDQEIIDIQNDINY
ncbi:tetratricopeptide repeat protein [Dellaglioa sp. P0083]|uniref:tetratricopeptide repeat protein n=1 Tax=Dellaglioa kimchii TaxID=3344667 RepID=UPI0038D4371F